MNRFGFACSTAPDIRDTPLKPVLTTVIVDGMTFQSLNVMASGDPADPPPGVGSRSCLDPLQSVPAESGHVLERPDHQHTCHRSQCSEDEPSGRDRYQKAGDE